MRPRAASVAFPRLLRGDVDRVAQDSSSRKVSSVPGSRLAILAIIPNRVRRTDMSPASSDSTDSSSGRPRHDCYARCSPHRGTAFAISVVPRCGPSLSRCVRVRSDQSVAESSSPWLGARWRRSGALANRRRGGWAPSRLAEPHRRAALAPVVGSCCGMSGGATDREPAHDGRRRRPVREMFALCSNFENFPASWRASRRDGFRRRPVSRVSRKRPVNFSNGTCS